MAEGRLQCANTALLSVSEPVTYLDYYAQKGF